MASLFISKYKSGWRIIEEKWTDGIRKHKTVPRMAYRDLGIDPEWSCEKAKEVIIRINKQNGIEKRLQQTKVSAASRIINITNVEAVFLPRELVQEFSNQIDTDSFGSQSHIKRLHSHWRFIQIMLKEIQLKPQIYFDNKKRFYKYFTEHGMSLDYTNKILRMLNSWGYFYASKSQSFYRPVPVPRGVVRTSISKSARKHHTASKPLTPKLLEENKTRLDSKHYRWLFCSIWFGTRPTETDGLGDVEKTALTIQDKTQILNIYQSKLVSLEEEDRWKMIPILYPEQEKALEMIKGEIKRPLVKTLVKVFGKGFGVYAGRKGFELLMKERGHPIEHISSWLGHQSIDTTWRKYRNRRVASF